MVEILCEFTTQYYREVFTVRFSVKIWRGRFDTIQESLTWTEKLTVVAHITKKKKNVYEEETKTNKMPVAIKRLNLRTTRKQWMKMNKKLSN